jgi:Tol biopolymer transport system component
MAAAACTGDTNAPASDVRAISPDGVQHIAPRYSPDGTKLAWWAPSTDGAAGLQLWVANADQTDARKLPALTIDGGGPILWSPDGSKIVTASNQFSFSDLVLIPVAGGDARRVTQGPGFEVAISWHPDNDRLSYYATAEGSIRSYVVKMSTGATAPLIPGDTRPLVGYWSPDGSKISYFVGEGSHYSIWVADSVGRGGTALTKEGFEQFAFSNWGMTPWSPDGKEVLYESRRTGTADVWALDVTTGVSRQITRDVRNDHSAAWSPDGKHIAFISDRGRQVDVWVVPAAGGVEQRITDDGLEERWPDWRAGASTLAFVSTRVKSAVWTIDIASGAERQLTPDSVDAMWFNLARDGTQIDYIVNRGGAIHDLLVMPATGGAGRTILAGGGNIVEPLWAPDGKRIAFQSARGGSNDIWVLDPAGGAPRQVTNWPGNEYYPRWSRDSRWIYFVADRETRLGDLWRVSPEGGTPQRMTRDGSIDIYRLLPVEGDALVTVITASGAVTWSRLRPNGTLQPRRDGGNIFNINVPEVGDSIAMVVDRPGGGVQAMIAPLDGGRGRPILDRDEDIRGWSPDGKKLLYGVSVAGADDLGVVDVATGAKQRLTTTPQSELGAEWTPDGKSIVFRRVEQVRRIHAADLSRITAR